MEFLYWIILLIEHECHFRESYVTISKNTLKYQSDKRFLLEVKNKQMPSHQILQRNEKKKNKTIFDLKRTMLDTPRETISHDI